jgi:hypothetical protein
MVVNRGREGPKGFLNDYTEILLAAAYGGYNGVVAATPSRVPEVGRRRVGSSWRRRKRHWRSPARPWI